MFFTSMKAHGKYCIELEVDAGFKQRYIEWYIMQVRNLQVAEESAAF